MPIILDNTTNTDVNEQLAKLTDMVSKQDETPKLFSKNLTGTGRASTGLFNKSTGILNSYSKESERILGSHGIPSFFIGQQEDKIEEHHFGNQYRTSSKNKKDTFLLYDTASTVVTPLRIWSQPMEETAGPIAELPMNTPMYGLNQLMESSVCDIRKTVINPAKPKTLNEDNVWFVVGHGQADNQDFTVYASLVPQTIELYDRDEDPNTGGAPTSSTGKRKSRVTSRMDASFLVAVVPNSADVDVTKLHLLASQDANQPVKLDPENGFLTMVERQSDNMWSWDADRFRRQMMEKVNHFIQAYDTQATFDAYDYHELVKGIGETNIASQLTHQANQAHHHLPEIMDVATNMVGSMFEKGEQLRVSTNKDLVAHRNSLIAFIQHLDVINSWRDNLVTTEILSSVFEVLRRYIPDMVVFSSYARHSLRLLLSQRLYELDTIRKADGLYKFEAKDKAVEQAMKNNKAYSQQQKNIIMSPEPLIMGLAGAGSGKSHTLKGRIEYLEAQGEDISKLLVLSFTNVAAINITQRFPGVRSETLANMFNTIYSATFPTQELSQPSTVANAIGLLNPRSAYFQNLGLDPNELDTFMKTFAAQLQRFDQSGFQRVDLQKELKIMSNFIEENLEMTTHVLTAVGQTTLELQPIIIHHMLLIGGQHLNVPQVYQDLNYIVTDESQDISTFEYILLLELTIHYRSQLLIIGDSSQTLYEFRNSDPRYMNALEASGVFQSYKLETNYRSKQEILLYANEFLKVIDANQYAKIQLKSNSFTQPSTKTFDKTITLIEAALSGRSNREYYENLTNYLSTNDTFRDWFLEKIQKGEQVALMGWTRKEVLNVSELLREILDDNGLQGIEITNIMSDNERPTTVISKFCKSRQVDVRTTDPLANDYRTRLSKIVDEYIVNDVRSQSQRQANYYNSLLENAIDEVTQSAQFKAFQNDCARGAVTPNHVGTFLLQSLLRYEIRKNAMANYLRKDKSVPDYSKCPVIVSTIHGTKGLEFDNSIILFNEGKKGSTNQESLRMMFVAFSRARNSQLIVNSYRGSSTTGRSIGTTESAMYETPVPTAYIRVQKALHEAELAAGVQPAQHIQPIQPQDVADSNDVDTDDTVDVLVDSQDDTQDANDDTDKLFEASLGIVREDVTSAVRAIELEREREKRNTYLHENKVPNNVTLPTGSKPFESDNDTDEAKGNQS